MSRFDLPAIRARDADYDDVFEAQEHMPKDIAHRLAAWPVADRRALLAYGVHNSTNPDRVLLMDEIKLELEMYGADQPELTVDLPTAKGG